jgi:hypothetical protein
MHDGIEHSDIGDALIVHRSDQSEGLESRNGIDQCGAITIGHCLKIFSMQNGLFNH